MNLGRPSIAICGYGARGARRRTGGFEAGWSAPPMRPLAHAVARSRARCELLTVTPYGMASLDGEIRYFFPERPGVDPRGHLIDDLFAMDQPTPKEAMHDPVSVFTLWGAGIRAGVDIPDTTCLDIAPTLLTLMGIQPPSTMKGRVLEEAWGEKPVAIAAKTGASQPHA